MSLLCLVAGLLTREDTFAALPAVVLLGYFNSKRERRKESLVRTYTILLGLLCAGLYAYRHAILPRAPGLGHDVLGVFWGVWRAFQPLGIKGFDGWSHALLGIWWSLVAIAASAALFARRRLDLRPASLWLACTILAATPALNLRRENLLFFPVSFASLACVAVFQEVSRLGRVVKVLAAGALLLGIAGGAFMSQIFAENFHPRSLRVVWWNGRYVYGAYSRKAVIPRHRLEAVMRELAGAGIRDEWLHINRTRRLVQRALAAGRRRPGTEGRFFYPLLAWDED